MAQSSDMAEMEADDTQALCALFVCFPCRAFIEAGMEHGHFGCGSQFVAQLGSCLLYRPQLPCDMFENSQIIIFTTFYGLKGHGRAVRVTQHVCHDQ